MSVLFRLLSPAVVALVMLSCVSQVATASIEVNHNLFVELVDGSKVTGMFAGNTGDDDILIAGEVTSWMFEYTDSVSPLASFSLSSIGDQLVSFRFDSLASTFLDDFFMFVRIFLLYVLSELRWFSGCSSFSVVVCFLHGAFFSGNSFGNLGPTITPKESGQIPEPSSMLVWGGLGGLLISVVGIGRKRNR